MEIGIQQNLTGNMLVMCVLMFRDADVFPCDSHHTSSNMAGASQRELVTWLSLALSSAFKNKRDSPDATQHDQC